MQAGAARWSSPNWGLFVKLTLSYLEFCCWRTTLTTGINLHGASVRATYRYSEVRSARRSQQSTVYHYNDTLRLNNTAAYSDAESCVVGQLQQPRDAARSTTCHYQITLLAARGTRRKQSDNFLRNSASTGNRTCNLRSPVRRARHHDTCKIIIN